ncbi:protein-glutamate methylesterase/protein-glutamine glutaminase [Alteromonas macleodii]|uniref:protein-glutamate methylesterase/protein-glutamine glutaminase n=1 Tax=Alteromonas macleodii TaxID=28108 RepID=UPI003140A6E8
MIKVLVVDDSALVRQLLTEILNSHPEITVVGTAGDPYQARNKIKTLNPDVVSLDVEMPRMDGLTFLSNLIRLRPLPVVMVSSLTERGAEVTLEALSIGAVDFVSKPKDDLANSLKEYSDEIQSKIIAASKTGLGFLEERSKREAVRVSMKSSESNDVKCKYSVDAVLPKQKVRHYQTTDKVIAIGSSTGGTVALEQILVDLPTDVPGIVVSQHIPEHFSDSFARRLDSICKISVSEAKDGQQIMQGHCYIAPGNKHLIVKKSGAKYVISLSDDLPVNRHKPSVDVMFRSVATCVGPNALGIILTGMGADGAVGLSEMKEQGAYTIAQDEESSVVWGMPGSAVKLGGVSKIVPLEHMSNLMKNHF